MKTMTLKQFAEKVLERGVTKTDANCNDICERTAYLVKRNNSKVFVGDMDTSCNMLQIQALVRRGLFYEVTAGIHYQRSSDWRSRLHNRIIQSSFESLLKVA